MSDNVIPFHARGERPKPKAIEPSPHPVFTDAGHAHEADYADHRIRMEFVAVASRLSTAALVFADVAAYARSKGLEVDHLDPPERER